MMNGADLLNVFNIICGLVTLASGIFAWWVWMKSKSEKDKAASEKDKAAIEIDKLRTVIKTVYHMSGHPDLPPELHARVAAAAASAGKNLNQWIADELNRITP